MTEVINQVKSMSRYIFQTSDEHVMAVSGPGSAAMEMAIANLVFPKDEVLCVCNGYFSQRMAEMVRRVGGTTTIIEAAENAGIDSAAFEKALQKKKYRVVTIAQGETSNTVCNYQLPQISSIAKKFGCIVIVDAVCTLSTMELNMDAWGLDAVISGGQKGLASIPGVSLLAFSKEAWDRIAARKHPPSHWCFDALLADQFWNKGGYHYTAPVSGILALHEALRLVCIETLEVRLMRHKQCSTALQFGLQALGLKLLVNEPHRLNSVLGVKMPPGIDRDALRHHMSNIHKVEISGSFGLNIVRIGQMGEQSRSHNLFRTLHSLGSSLSALGAKVDLPTGMAALEHRLTLNQVGPQPEKTPRAAKEIALTAC